MKKLTLLLVSLLSQLAFSQANIDQILEIGIENAQRFSEDYFAPAGEGVINGMSNGWYTTAEAKELFHFEIGIVGNASFVRKEKRSFILDESRYTGVTFRDGPDSQSVANVFGENGTDVVMVVNEGEVGEFEITLPDGIGGTGVGAMPTAFLQASIGVTHGTEVKMRFLPKMNVEADTEIKLYGVAIQHEFTSWMAGLERLPVKMSAIIGYTNLKASYDFTADSVLDGEGQVVDFKANSWLVSSIISTKFPLINFYVGLGYYTGNSTTDLRGTYLIERGPITTPTVIDPVSVAHNSSGVKATVGTRVKFSFFRINVDYSLQNYNNLSVGINFGW